VILCQVGYNIAENKRTPLNELAAQHILFTQRVGNVKTVQRRRMKKQKAKDLPNPYEEIDALEKYLDAVRQAEKEHACPKSKKEEYEKDIRKREKYLDKLQDMVRPLDRGRCTPIFASYVSKNTSQQVDLRVCIDEKFDTRIGGSSHEIWLLDSTNPMDRRLRGRYWAKAKSRPDAIKKVLEDWRENNEYYHPGNVVLEFQPDLFANWNGEAKPDRRTFDTPGKGVWGKIQDFFEAVALALAVATAVVAMVVPIPGSRVVSGLIWASVFASSAAAGIAIGTRKRNDLSDHDDDVFDVLTIVGNVFTAGRMGWARRAVFVSKAFGGNFKRFAFYGEVATDALQGLLIAEEKMTEFEAILSDPTLSPKERVDKMLEFTRSAIVSGAISFASAKGTKRKGKRPDMHIPHDMKKRIENPGETIDLDKLHKQSGHTRDGRLKTKVQDEPARPRGKKGNRTRPKRKRGKFDFDPAPHAHERGMRARDDFDFEEAALKGPKEKIILVRDSNNAMHKHINDKTKAPKPEELKAKSLQEGDYAGLAAAHPNDPRLKEMLQAMKPPMSYDDFIKDLNKKGFKVAGSDKDFIVTSDKYPGGYYSDYDLHGVYTKDGKRAYSEKLRGELNERFGKDLVQHGPHDEWPKRNSSEAGPNRGPQPPVTAYVPHNGEVKKFHLKTIDDMREFYQSWGMPWRNIYPNH
jgi:hypothetical protein